jgi:hypothetical protein
LAFAIAEPSSPPALTAAELADFAVAEPVLPVLLASAVLDDFAEAAAPSSSPTNDFASAWLAALAAAELPSSPAVAVAVLVAEADASRAPS